MELYDLYRDLPLCVGYSLLLNVKEVTKTLLFLMFIVIHLMESFLCLY